MPKLYTDHTASVRLERELDDIWRKLDTLAVRENRARALTRGVPGGPALLLTTKGDLLTHDGSEDAVLRAGADDDVLLPDAAEPVGLKWSSVLADHLVATGDPHGSTMAVSVGVITPQVFSIGDITFGAFGIAQDRTVFVVNTAPGFVAHLDVQGDIAVGGEVDGRNLADDGTKLDSLELSETHYTLLAAGTAVSF